jgi:hypothetical protein
MTALNTLGVPLDTAAVLNLESPPRLLYRQFEAPNHVAVLFSSFHGGYLRRLARGRDWNGIGT